MNGQTYNTNNVIPISDHHSYIDFHKKNNKNNNGNGGGGNDMEKRLSKLEAGIDYIKEKLSSHDDEFKKIDDKFDKIDARFDKIDARLDKTENIYTKLESSVKVINTKLDNLKENCISYKGLFGMFAVFTTIIGFFIKYFH
ncbi:hypothetical protein [Commensalibacter melissae]|uniref:hypothetical protein n=1 Tax=Commensalibacter melissae TaxID=2070537 RepID=UPI0012D890B6|nr:hypothetical protein [Commensalibacter melissae]MUH07213.1 hypothetical protein [Commensalibacter melissae]